MTSALAQGAESVATRVAGRLDPGVILRLSALAQGSDGDPDATDDGEVEADPSLPRRVKSSEWKHAALIESPSHDSETRPNASS